MGQALALLDDEMVVGTPGETDDQGNPTSDVPTNLTAVSSDESIVTASVGADGSLTVSTVGPTGTAVVTVSADGPANPDGSAGASLTDDINVAVGTSAPTAIGLTFGDPSKR